MKILKVFVLTIVLNLFLMSCAHNPYKNYFVAEKSINSIGVEKITGSVEPTLYVSKNMSKAILKMRSNGYVLVGSSEFENGIVSFNKAIEQARNIDAQFVVVQKENTGSYTGYYPKKFKTAAGNRKIPKNKTDFVEIPYIVEKYGYVATYWSKKM